MLRGIIIEWILDQEITYEPHDLMILFFLFIWNEIKKSQTLKCARTEIQILKYIKKAKNICNFFFCEFSSNNFNTKHLFMHVANNLD